MTIALRSPDVVMRFARLGASHPTRLSFLRGLMRRAARENWSVRRAVWEMDDAGFGRAVYVLSTQERQYSLVAFSTRLDPSNRTDRVIAQAWDSSYVLYDGVPDAGEVARLEANVPRQEAGRFTSRELVLARANKSVRLFDTVVGALSQGQQPGTEELLDVGYLMRSTAVYGNGKFGISDRDRFAVRPELSAPFQAEMLTVWMIRSFTIELAEHIARQRNPAVAVRLDSALRLCLGLGNATGLGMAPFLVRHPLLLHNWIHARESALARVRSLQNAGERESAAFMTALEKLRDGVRHWQTTDQKQAEAVIILNKDLDALAVASADLLKNPSLQWNAIYEYAAENLSLEAQEACVALLIEPHGNLVDDLANHMAADETTAFDIDGRMTCGALKSLVDETYAWASKIDFKVEASNARFWYVSAEKQEPRLGERFEEEGAELEQPLAVARDAVALSDMLGHEIPETLAAEFLMQHPEWRHAVRRAQLAAKYCYADIRDNLIGSDMRPVDLLRSKLAFFGARNFDPRSDRWLRIALFAGEPLIEDIGALAASGIAA